MTVLSQRLDENLSVRRGLGYNFSFAGRVLRGFAAFADREGTDHITIDLFLRWKDAFARVSQGIGLRETERFGRHGRGPRIHDLRHTFAVMTIMGWYRGGADPDREMIKLSTYLGRGKPDNTYWYIEAVSELLQLASERAEQSLALGLTP
jgi:integrase